jgi:hypothetical protein
MKTDLIFAIVVNDEELSLQGRVLLDACSCSLCSAPQAEDALRAVLGVSGGGGGRGRPLWKHIPGHGGLVHSYLQRNGM